MGSYHEWECDSCSAKSGTPALCQHCLRVRELAVAAFDYLNSLSRVPAYQVPFIRRSQCRELSDALPAALREKCGDAREVLPDIKDAKIKALESTIELLRKGMAESCCDDRHKIMGGCVYAAELTEAARAYIDARNQGLPERHCCDKLLEVEKLLENEQ